MSNVIKVPSLATVLLIALPVHGLGIRIADQSAFATARGNAFAATADDPSAIYYNPAGITQLKGQNFLGGSYGISLGSEYTAPDGSRSNTKSGLQLTPQFFYTFTPQDQPFSFGLGFYTPYGLSLKWPDNSTFRATEGRITYLTINPAFAWQVNPTFSIGGGITLNYARAELSQTLLARTLFPPGGQNRFDGDGTDVGFNLGVMWRPFEKHSFGLSYYSPAKINLAGISSNSGADLANIPSGSVSANADFQFPQHAVAGWSYRPTTNWNVEVNVDWTDWDSLNVVTVNQAPAPVALPFNWKSSFFYEFGVTYYFQNGLRVSGGYIFSENSVPDATFNPVVPDSDRHIFSLGVGGQYKNFRWDVAYQFAYGPQRTVNNDALAFPIGATSSGRYEFVSHAIALTVGYGF